VPQALLKHPAVRVQACLKGGRPGWRQGDGIVMVSIRAARVALRDPASVPSLLPDAATGRTTTI